MAPVDNRFQYEEDVALVKMAKRPIMSRRPDEHDRTLQNVETHYRMPTTFDNCRHEI